MEELAKEILPQIVNATKLGPIAACGTALMLLIRIYRLEFLQNLLPQRARWESFPPAAKLFLPFGLALLGSFLLSLAGGSTVLSSLAIAIPAAVVAISSHAATKYAGQSLTNSGLKTQGPLYQPSPFRNMASIVVPLGKIPVETFDKTP